MSEQTSGQTSELIFFDPFAPEGEQVFDPLLSHDVLVENYLQNKVEHNTALDDFVAQTEALMLDAQFTGMFEQAQAIASRMHAMCADHAGLQQTMQQSGIFGEHGQDDGHGHGSGGTEAHDDHDDKDDEDEKNSKKKKKKHRYSGWLAQMLSKS